MEAVQNIGLIALAGIFVRFLTQLSARDWDAVVKTLIAMGAGVGAVVLFAHSSQGAAQDIDGIPLDQLGGADLLLLGLSVGALMGSVHVLTKAIDQKQSAAQPPLLHPVGTQPAVAASLSAILVLALAASVLTLLVLVL